MYIPDFETEKLLLKNDNLFVVGVDEAGRGPLAGPVVAAAVAHNDMKRFLKSNNDDERKGIFKGTFKDTFLDNEEEYALVRDSKTLSEKQRERAYDFIMKNFFVGIGLCDENTIDRINILEASFLAMKKAINDLKEKIKNYGRQLDLQANLLTMMDEKIIVLVDGNKQIPNFSMNQRAIVQGDKKVKSIAGASIVAKVTRDEIMKAYDKKYPEYGFAQHKGYGTKIHMEALEKYGACKIHRQSFKPVKKLSDKRN